MDDVEDDTDALQPFSLAASTARKYVAHISAQLICISKTALWLPIAALTGTPREPLPINREKVYRTQTHWQVGSCPLACSALRHVTIMIWPPNNANLYLQAKHSVAYGAPTCYLLTMTNETIFDHAANLTHLWCNGAWTGGLV